MTRRLNRPWFVVLALLLLLAAGNAFSDDPSDEAVPLHVGFGRASFLSVNLVDAKAAFKVFTKSVGTARGYDLDVVVHTYDSNEDFQTAVARGDLHLVIMTSWEYLSAQLREHLEPRFLAIESGYGPREYVLLVRDDSAYGELADLRGKHIVLLENTNCEMSGHWMRALLLRERLGEESVFFGELEWASKPTQALLPVFFEQADACVVSRPIFDTMCEMNPQLRRQLRSIAVSKPLVDGITFVAYDGWIEPHYRSDLIESLGSLHRDPHGQQILTLFKSDRLAPFEDHMLDGTRALKAEYDQLLDQSQGE